MKLPPRFVAGNLVWGRDGSTWAVYRVEGRSYPWLPIAERDGFLSQVRALLRGLPEESLVLSACVRLSPTEIVEVMSTRGEAPEWRSLCSHALEALSTHPAYVQTFWLALKLPERSFSFKQLRAAASKGMDQVLGKPLPRPGWRERESAHAQAESLLDQVATSLQMRPATAEEVSWLYARAVLRGTDREPGLGDSEGPMVAVDELELRSIGAARWDEGGIGFGKDRDPGRRGWHYLRIERHGVVSYQAFLCLARMPERWEHMGASSEWFLRVGELGFPVDWAVRLQATPNAVAQRTAAKKRKQLIDQVDEQGDDSDLMGEGIPGDLGQAIIGSKIEQQRLAAFPNDPELSAAIVFAVYGDNLAQVESWADTLTATLGNREHALERPLGHQSDCFTAMLPAGDAKEVMRSYRQVLLPIDLASGAPFADVGLGDSSGLLFGLLADSKRIRLVMLDPQEGHRIGGSGSAGFFGLMGSGKSYAMKKLLKGSMAQGGAGVVFDITRTQEWKRATRSMAGRWEEVDLTADAPISLDPLRVFADPEEGRKWALGFCILVTGVNPRGPEGTCLAEAVREAAECPHPSLPLALEALHRMSREGIEGAPQAVRYLETFAKRPRSGRWLGALAFDEARAPLSLSADGLLFLAQGLNLPTKETLMHPVLSQQLLPEQYHAQALVYLVAAVMKAFITADPGRFAVGVMDEAWSLLSSLQGQELAKEAVNDGRKNFGAMWFGSPHVGHLGSDELASMLTYRFLFAQGKGAGAEALRWIGVDDSPENVLLVEEGIQRVDTEGKPPTPARCLVRDPSNRVGLVTVLPEGDGPAFETNPLRLSGMGEGRRRPELEGVK